jgi:CheY-like chemotaxis protein
VASRARVLAVDDERGVLTAVGRLLSRHYDLVTIDDPTEALRRIREGERWDVVLCDMRMPEMSGRELNDHVRAIDADQAARFVFFTATAREADSGERVGTTGNLCIPKPASGADMRAVIDRVVAERGCVPR